MLNTFSIRSFEWLAILKSDKSAIITAAAKAEQAYRWLSAWSATQPEGVRTAGGVRAVSV